MTNPVYITITAKQGEKILDITVARLNSYMMASRVFNEVSVRIVEKEREEIRMRK